MLVTLTRHTQVDQWKGLWCFDTSPILGYTIGSNKQMYLGGDRGIPHGFSCTSLLPQILVDFRIEIELNVGPYLTPSSLIKRLELPCTGQFTLLPLKSSSRSGTHFQGSEKSANFVFSHFHRVPPWHFWHLCDPIEKFNITSPPMPDQWRPQLQYSDTGRTTSVDPKSVCAVLVCETFPFSYRSVPINS